jgi:hypothetical protein
MFLLDAPLARLPVAPLRYHQLPKNAYAPYAPASRTVLVGGAIYSDSAHRLCTLRHRKLQVHPHGYNGMLFLENKGITSTKADLALYMRTNGD